MVKSGSDHSAAVSTSRAPAADDGSIYAQLLDSIAAGVLVHRGFQPLYANPACAQLLGFATPAQIIAQSSLLTLFSHEGAYVAKSRCERLLQGEILSAPAIVECLCPLAGDHGTAGSGRWLEMRETLIDWNGAAAVSVTFSDASHKMQAHRHETLLREAIDNLSDSFILYDADERVVLTNRRFHEVFPFLAEQDRISGTPMIELVHANIANGSVMDPTLAEHEPEDWIELFMQRRRSNKLFLEEDTWPDGRWDLVKEQRLDSGGFVSMRIDITARKQAEFALKEHESRLEKQLTERTRQLEAVLANIVQGIIVLNPDLRVVLTNQGLHDIVGYPLVLGTPGTHVEELIRDRLLHGLFLPGEPQEEVDVDVEAIVAARLQAYQNLTRETYRHRFPNQRLIEIRRQKLADGMIVCTFTDVTEQANAEAELQHQREALYQREKLSALGLLLAGVAHELNNPLSVVLGQAQLIETAAKAAADEALQRRAGKVRHAAQRCARIVRTFLALARNEPASRAPLQINQMIEQAIDLLAYQLRSNNIEVVSELAPELPEIQGDADQLNQVLVNLLINAAQALAEVERARRITLRSSYWPANDEVEFSISDSGPGVPEELRLRIFDPFFTTKPVGVGTGVGLSVCHGMVTAHGGSITVEQAADGGAQFRVKLPVGTAAAAEQDAVIISDKGTGHGRILIVDDHSEICEMLIEFFDGTGLQAEAATSGHKALQQLKTNDYDAIICDLRMPEMDGPALYAAIGASRPELQARFIFATGDLLSAGSRQFLEDSGRPCLEKPFQPDQVRRLVVQTLERRPLL